MTLEPVGIATKKGGKNAAQAQSMVTDKTRGKKRKLSWDPLEKTDQAPRKGPENKTGEERKCGHGAPRTAVPGG